MSENQPSGADAPADLKSAEDIVASSDTGARVPGGAVGRFIIGLTLAWSIFQLWIASPLPYMMSDWIPILNNSHTRPTHLGFAIFLTYIAFPATKNSPRDRIPIQDWVLAVCAAWCSMYLAVFSADIAERPGLPTTADIIFSGAGLLFLLEAARRALGPPLMVVAGVFLAYIFFGQYAPDVIAWKGASVNRAMSHLWLTQEGVFGIAIGVSTSLVFLFVLFGSMLEKAGAGNYFIRVAFALMGHMRGGPAKAAVVSSAMMGFMSGSSIANVVTTGTFTIPLMKRVGFPAEKAGAIEVASSTNGQLTPPVMGAAAFLMVEFVGISYVEVITHALLPAVISYIALVYIVHLEALKADMQGLPRRVGDSTLVQKLLAYGGVAVGILVLSAVIYYGFGWLKGAAGEATPYIAAVALVGAYTALVKYSCYFPELPDVQSIDELPDVGPTAKAGLYYLLPVVLLVWCLVVERLSPGLSAFWACTFMIFILVTQRPLQALFRGTADLNAAGKRGLGELFDGLVTGARNMIGIGVAVAAAGIIVGAVTLTGIGLVMTGFVELISGGNVVLLLIFTAIISLILGMGLPTTANYIVVSSLMAQVIVTLGAQAGLVVPLIAVHMFVFYFGILADDTPPVGLAAFAAAAVSGGDPIKTGIQGFMYDIRTGILPFMFIFNTELLLIGIEGPIHLILVVVSALGAMLLFAAATQGFFIARNKLWETVALLLVTFTLFRPGFWMDMIEPPTIESSATEIEQVAAALPADAALNIKVQGETLEGTAVLKTVPLPMGPAGVSGKERLAFAGLEVTREDGRVVLEPPSFGSAAEKQKLEFGWEIVAVVVENDRLPKQIMWIPALALLALIVVAQRRRRDGTGAKKSEAAAKA